MSVNGRFWGAAAPHPDQVVIAGEQFDGILRKIQVAVHRHREIAERRLHLSQRKLVVQHIDVSDQDDGVVGPGFLQSNVSD